jgi:hypothetical protein
MRSSLPLHIGIAVTGLTLVLIALGSGITADSKPISISGVVLLDGQPLLRGRILFFSQGTDQPACDVSLIQNGEYAISGSQNLIPATYEVRISGLDEHATSSTKEPLPSRYNSQSVLRVQIKQGGTHRFNFELKP